MSGPRGTVGLASVVAVASVALLLAPPARAVPDGPPQRSVAVVGDFGSGTPDEGAVAALVAAARPVALVTTGDNVYSNAGYAALVGAYYEPSVAPRNVLPAVGNHDHAEGIGAFDDYFAHLGGRHVYAAGRGGIRFFFLDSTVALDSPQARQRQASWLRRSLTASTARWKVVVLHHPPYSSGVVHGSTSEVQWPFGAWGADLVLSGHEHNYERVVRDATTFVVDGSGGKDLYSLGAPVRGSRVRIDSGFGALFLTATTTALIGEFWSTAGIRLDRFVLRQ